MFKSVGMHKQGGWILAELTKELKAFWKDQLVPFHHEQLPQSGLSRLTETSYHRSGCRWILRR